MARRAVLIQVMKSTEGWAHQSKGSEWIVQCTKHIPQGKKEHIEDCKDLISDFTQCHIGLSPQARMLIALML
ncbi:hypothetical protein PoB_001558700 [Plakobranchus ocellatus]|uniref:Uncharacterized protein n=1 Tax=Plakobranchus ocellatus TaxID=259542 RepID=A0AAV3Z3F4_9GAST|nr:hypothetical protein PoB_001558700 [Plakobranchus ocellatus]